LIRAAKIVLSDSQWPDADGFVSNRLFQSLAAGGALVLQQRFKGYEKLGFVDGEHLIIWNELDDLVDRLHYWLRSENEDRRQGIAAAGQAFCLEHHSFDVRVLELCQMISGIR
jgi:spore maturation protein CgeB